MTSRRLIRIKVLHMLYSYMKKENTSLAEIERELLKSIEKSTELYYFLLLLLTEIQRKAFLVADAKKNKYIATQEELHPNTRFIDNPVFPIIANNKSFQNFVRNNLLSWNDRTEIISHIYNEMLKSEAYLTYMAKDQVTFEDHKKILIDIFLEQIAGNEVVIQTLEDKNIFWNDDYELIFELVYKTIKKIKSSYDENKQFFYQVYRSEEDIDFAKTLLRKSILEYDKNIALITQFVKNWEVERLSDIDTYIMVIALTELKHFSSIPVKVSLDEYIEISKSYSSAKSGAFINGVLDKAVIYLKENQEIKKIGRGLME